MKIEISRNGDLARNRQTLTSRNDRDGIRTIGQMHFSLDCRVLGSGVNQFDRVGDSLYPGRTQPTL